MKVRRIDTVVVAVPLARTITSRVRRTDHVINVISEVRTDTDLVGVSYVAAFSLAHAAAIVRMVEHLEEALVERDASAVGALWQQMWRAARLPGRSGVTCNAMAAIDMALWDLLGKELDAPLHKLLGTVHGELPVYASDGCWLDAGPAEAAAEAERFAMDGFVQVKVRLGRDAADDDFAVLDAVRSGLGDKIEILCDVNQGWSRDEAGRLAPRLADYGIRWLEEPLDADDLAGTANLRRHLPIVGGESAYLPDGVARMLTAGAVDIVMPDLQRVGGITGWVSAAKLAANAGTPLTSHLYPEVSVHLLASTAEPLPLEWVDWQAPLLMEPAQVVGGMLTVPQSPGLGIAFDPAAVRSFHVD